jgi:hypothetical protein
MRRFISIAESYRRHRAERDGRNKAAWAFQWAKTERDVSAFWYRAEGVSKYQTSFCNTDGAEVWNIESKSGALRVELAIMPDYDGDDGRDYGSEDYASFLRFFRETEKLGKHAAHVAAVKALRQYKEDQEDDGRDLQTYGVAVRVFYNVPRLEDGEPIAEDALWGITVADDDNGERYLWECLLQTYQEATAGLCGKIRTERREAFRAMMSEAFAANFAI